MPEGASDLWQKNASLGIAVALGHIGLLLLSALRGAQRLALLDGQLQSPSTYKFKLHVLSANTAMNVSARALGFKPHWKLRFVVEEHYA